MNALTVIAHPSPTSLNHALAQTAHQSLIAAGAHSVFIDLHQEQFDPVMTREEALGQPTVDPAVRRHIELLRAADILVVVHPNCWGSPPAMMKGWMDRVFAPGAAYAFEKGSDAGDAPVGLLRASAALVINTSNTPEQREREVFGDPLERIWRHCLLEYCGVKCVKRLVFRVVATSTREERGAWLESVARATAEAISAAKGSRTA
jgi:NAD(P)H dehydrogenase (quinone)